MGYDALGNWFKNQPANKTIIQLTFAEVEAITGQSLPESARKYTQWWRDAKRASSQAWVANGWTLDKLDLAGELVTFRRA